MTRHLLDEIPVVTTPFSVRDYLYGESAFVIAHISQSDLHVICLNYGLS